MPTLDLLKTQIKSYPKNRQSNRQKPEIRTKAHQPTVLRSLQLLSPRIRGGRAYSSQHILEPDPKVFEQYQYVVIHPSLRRDGVNGDMDWYCPT